MNYQVFYYILLTVFFAGSLWLFFRVIIGTSYPGSSTGGRYSRYGMVAKYIKGRVSKGKGSNLFAGTGIDLPPSFYQTARFFIFGVWLMAAIILKITDTISSFNLQLFLCVLLFIATSPKENIGSLKLPFFYIGKFLQKRKRQIYSKEIYRTISQMINLFTLKGEKNVGSNYIFEEIIKFSRATRPVYQHMLSIWNMNRREEAADYFASAIGTKDAKDLSTVFLKLDYLNPGELKNQLIHYRNNMRSEKVTLREKINERNGNFMYVLAIVSAIVVLLNFLVIVLVVEVFASYSLMLD
ncbi:MAG: hypothetical protein H8E13_00970 [Actinobacteria bacterium]|nr:hypothetical protein [Actinomycetota bacterium]